jgi:hypothetical protein
MADMAPAASHHMAGRGAACALRRPRAQAQRALAYDSLSAAALSTAPSLARRPSPSRRCRALYDHAAAHRAVAFKQRANIDDPGYRVPGSRQ